MVAKLTKLLLLAPISAGKDRDLSTVIKILKQQGFSRLKDGDQIVRIDAFERKESENLWLVVDRVVVQHDRLIPVEVRPERTEIRSGVRSGDDVRLKQVGFFEFRL